MCSVAPSSGGCGKRNAVFHYLHGQPPRVFTLQLAWERQDESGAAIAATLDAISETINLSAPQLAPHSDAHPCQ